MEGYVREVMVSVEYIMRVREGRVEKGKEGVCVRVRQEGEWPGKIKEGKVTRV